MSNAILKNSLIYFCVTVTQSLLQIILLPIHTHYLSLPDYGIFATINSCSSILNILLNIGLYSSAQRFTIHYLVPKDKSNILLSTVFFSSMISAVVISLLSIFVIYTINQLHLIRFPYLYYLIYCLLHSSAMCILLAGQEILRMQKKAVHYAAIFISMYFSYLIISIVLISVLHMGLTGALISFTLMPWFGCIALYLGSSNLINFKIDNQLSKKLFSYSFKLLPYLILDIIIMCSDRLIIAATLGKKYTGLYTTGALIGSLVGAICSAVALSARPEIYKDFNKHCHMKFSNINLTADISFKIFGFISANAAFWSPEALHILTSYDFHLSWPVAFILSFKQFLVGASMFIVCSILYNNKKAHLLSLITMMSFLVFLFCTKITLNTLGIYGVALSSLLSTVFYTITLIRLAHRLSLLRWPIKSLIQSSLVFFIPALFGTIIADQFIDNLAGIFLFKTLVSLSLLAILYHWSGYDKNAILAVFRHRSSATI